MSHGAMFNRINNLKQLENMIVYIKKVQISQNNLDIDKDRHTKNLNSEFPNTNQLQNNMPQY